MDSLVLVEKGQEMRCAACWRRMWGGWRECLFSKGRSWFWLRLARRGCYCWLGSGRQGSEKLTLCRSKRGLSQDLRSVTLYQIYYPPNPQLPQSPSHHHPSPLPPYSHYSSQPYSLAKPLHSPLSSYKPYSGTQTHTTVSRVRERFQVGLRSIGGAGS